MVLIAAQTFADWSTGVAAIATVVAIFIGGAWALWRYMLPGFAPTWGVAIGDCTARRLLSGDFAYIVRVSLTNTSVTSYVVDRFSMNILFLEGEETSDDHWEVLGKVEPMELVNVFPPQVERYANQSIVGDKDLRHSVVVLVQIQYRRRRFGIFRWVSHEYRASRETPVDDESVALYMEPASTTMSLGVWRAVGAVALIGTAALWVRKWACAPAARASKEEGYHD